MNSIDRLNKLRDAVPSNIKIVAVSKTKPAASIELLYSKSGQRIFGENKVQELEAKHEILPTDIEWHFIGHLQTNKIKYIAPFVSLIQSVDSFRLLREINKEALKQNRIIPCLLQFYIASEEAKYGFSLEEAFLMLDNNLFHELSNISIKGVMGMATYTNDKQQIRTEFKTLLGYFELIKSRYFAQENDFCEISMGMTDDYLIAIEEGSTIVRIGSGIFGER
ncbi:MAG: YggS family pyridoxal phosphate-dependent enzyme [Bacteroidales bacterium]|nr:YggS family pyridoxal phosphate-dependent enzyme [Bacteroidales bacterium]